MLNPSEFKDLAWLSYCTNNPIDLEFKRLALFCNGRAKLLLSDPEFIGDQLYRAYVDNGNWYLILEGKHLHSCYYANGHYTIKTSIPITGTEELFYLDNLPNIYGDYNQVLDCLEQLYAAGKLEPYRLSNFKIDN